MARPMNLKLFVGDALDILPSIRDGEIDSVVTDPPYELGFMGKAWDASGVAFRPETWDCIARPLRPGGYVLAFGGTRSYHRMTCAIEDAGLEIVDCLAWIYAQGFPKHESKLKPAFEPIVMARKKGPVLNLAIDACRIDFANDADEAETKGKNRHEAFDSGPRQNNVFNGDDRPRTNYDAPGRYPANVIFDEGAAAMLDEQTGDRPSSTSGIRKTKNIMKLGGENRRPNHGDVDGTQRTGYADRGGASRFFYCAKASRRERDAGLDGLEKKPIHWSSGDKTPGSFQSAGTEKSARNYHPTVKPIALMRWLTRLVTPGGGTVIDPFVGSGSTGAACGLEGFHFYGIDLSNEFVEIARRRIIHWRNDDLFA